jgi:hypothetical protein
MAKRVARAAEIQEAFRSAGVGVHVEHSDEMPKSTVIAFVDSGSGWTNPGTRWERQIIVFIGDNGDCIAYMTKFYVLPEGKTGADVDTGEETWRLLFEIPGSTPDLGEAVVRKAREASDQDQGTMPTRLIAPPPLRTSPPPPSVTGA